MPMLQIICISKQAFGFDIKCLLYNCTAQKLLYIYILKLIDSRIRDKIPPVNQRVYILQKTKRNKMEYLKLFCISVIVISIINLQQVNAWDNDEFEIFDLVEEVNVLNKNFYEFMEISNDASTSEIRKAYRRLSLVLHPDKNTADDAETQFRWLAAIYETLKDPKKREIYDRVLVEGLPDWRMPVFYMRRMRKVGLAEGLAYLLVFATVIQYAVNWASYWEKKFTMREQVSNHLNKRSTQKKVKRSGKDVDADALEKDLENTLEERGYTKPTIYGLLPFQILRGTKDLCFGIPKLPSQVYAMVQEHQRTKAEEEKRIKDEEEEFERKENEKKERKEQQRQRKLAQKQYEEKEGIVSTNKTKTQAVKEAKKLPRNAQQLWTDDDLAKLAKLIKKYPGGTPDRWETIAEMMERLPWEVTKMAGTIKGTLYQVSIQIINVGRFSNPVGGFRF